MCFCLFACGNKENNNNKDYGYSYPTGLLGGHAVWLTEKENKICREPEIRNGDQSVTAKIYLDLYTAGLSRLSDYFMLIEANGYKKVDNSRYEFDASKWKLLDYKKFESFNAE